ncbi:hypothetical protein BH20ACT15_BH20ACT15_07440 [soil metagenome]
MADRGYFPQGESMLRRVHSERSVGLLYGQRALIIGALNPLNFTWTYEHTAARLKPFQRLARTAEAFETIFFGTRAEADKVLAYVGKMHSRVKGELESDAGVTPAGAPYSAFDPKLMLWTMAVIADSGRYFYELFVRRLDAGEREALWRDYVRFAELFGMPREAAPASYPEFREYFDGEVTSERAHLTPAARQVGYWTAFDIPLPRVRGLGKPIHNLIVLGSLLPRVRELYGLSWSPGQAAAFRAAVRAVRASRPVTPRALRRGYNTSHFRLVARTERRRLERGQATPQAV